MLSLCDQCNGKREGEKNMEVIILALSSVADIRHYYNECETLCIHERNLLELSRHDASFSPCPQKKISSSRNEKEIKKINS